MASEVLAWSRACKHIQIEGWGWSWALLYGEDFLHDMMCLIPNKAHANKDLHLKNGPEDYLEPSAETELTHLEVLDCYINVSDTQCGFCLESAAL